MTTLEVLGGLSMIFVIWFTQRAYRDDSRVDGRQSRRQDIIEAWSNIGFGFSCNWLTNWVILPMMVSGGQLTASSNFWGGWCFTVVSIARQYTIRRNAHHIHRFAAWLSSRFA